MKENSLVQEQVDFSAIGEQISHELCRKMVKNHHDVHGDEASFSYVIGSQIINKVLAQPGCVGIRFVDAINEDGVNTLVYVGIDAQGNNLIEITTVNDMGKLAVTEGMGNDKALPGHAW